MFLSHLLLCDQLYEQLLCLAFEERKSRKALSEFPATVCTQKTSTLQGCGCQGEYHRVDEPPMDHPALCVKCIPKVLWIPLYSKPASKRVSNYHLTLKNKKFKNNLYIKHDLQ